MSIVVTNQLTITSDRADEVVSRFSQNMQSLDTFDGFEGFELCKPTEPADDRWIVITRWRDQEAFLDGAIPASSVKTTAGVSANPARRKKRRGHRTVR